MPVARIAALAGFVLVTGAVFIAGGGGERDSTVLTDGTRGTANPASPPEIAPPPPDAPGRFGESVIVGDTIVEGTTTDGRAWVLHVGGPSNDLCFSVDASTDIGIGGMTGVCGGRPRGGPVPPEERHRPLIGGDLRTPPFVFGRMPDGVVAVEVVLEEGAPPARQLVHRSDEGPVYVVELQPGTNPVGVVGVRADGTSVRFDVVS
jgi:hypothetical protein